jgi:hypothetical protein
MLAAAAAGDGDSVVVSESLDTTMAAEDLQHALGWSASSSRVLVFNFIYIFRFPLLSLFFLTPRWICTLVEE